MWAGSSLPRLSQVVARLEQRGWVRRTPDPADGRYTLATLTGHGQAKVTPAAPGHVQEVRRLVFDPLTKTQSRQLREIGQRIPRAIDPEGDHQPQPAAHPHRATPVTGGDVDVKLTFGRRRCCAASPAPVGCRAGSSRRRAAGSRPGR